MGDPTAPQLSRRHPDRSWKAKVCYGNHQLRLTKLSIKGSLLKDCG
ncbi:hypothetical protein [Bacillus weihaiensis]|nr:hypothetical protein [Bacillus weihaiensis]